jgi:coiled-coil domain-containing protein 77
LAKELGKSGVAAEPVGPNAVEAKRKLKARKGQGVGGPGGMALAEKDRVETLLLTVEALQAQMEDNARLANEKELALTEDRRVREEEIRAVQVGGIIYVC